MTLGAASMVPVGIARADVAGQMNDFFQDAGGAANVTGPSAYQGQSAGYYSMGNVWSRFPQKSVQPFNLQMPKATAGCGGIDIFTGSFSFINGAEMVAMLKATANNALGFAFQLAIDSVSPEIGKVMDGMANKAQQMNQMNISSCEAAQGLVGSVWPKMTQARSTVCAAVGNSQGKFSDWARSRQGCGTGGEQDATLDGNTDPAMADKIPGNPRNYTWDAIKKSNKFGTDREFSEFLMTLVGTIVINPKAPEGAIVGFVGPAEDAVVTALLDGAGTGAPVKILHCEDDACLNMTQQTLRPGPGLRIKIKNMIDSINGKIRTDSALNAQEQQLLNMTSLPLYKMLAVQAMAHQNFADGETSALAEIVSVSLLSSMIENMLDRLSQSTVHVQPADAEMGKMWRDQLAQARTRYSERNVELKATLNQTIALINKSVMLESTLQNSMSPAMAASLNFSRGLSAQGLN
ncbi:conjugal transfer protein TraH [Sphingomonas sp. 2R-10]|nr:conjugal transfer protein TraH [Sphingomonas sp. 2R-10]MDJ0277647.1 conjugal transfer protein TraH [Sphingomonas sp. 2R-10]